VLLDGRNRLDALSLLPDAEKRIAEALQLPIRKEPSTDPWKYVRSVNLHRRHLTAEQKRDAIAELLKADPSRSNRSIAKDVGSNRTTVGQIREGLEKSGDVSIVDTRTDTKGRQQPATKPPQISKEAQPRALREQQATGAAATSAPEMDPNRFRVADELLQLARMLQGDRSRIDQIPLAKRVALARGCLMALNVTLDDLRPIGDSP
jgi:hypothetical protein